MRRKLVLVLYSFIVTVFVYSQNDSYFDNGDWYKISVENDGIHRLTYSDLSSFGINLNNLNISSIRIFGNGGGMLSKLNSDPRYDDIVENAIEIVDLNNNEIFESEDYILFYAQSPNRWKFDNTTQQFNFIPHLYSEKTYYFLTISESEIGKRVSQYNFNGTPGYFVNSFNSYAIHEQELVNLIGSGNSWYGEKFEFQNSYSFNFKAPHISFNSPVYLRTEVAARSLSPSNFKVYLDNNVIQTINIDNILPDYATEYAKRKSQTANFIASQDEINIGITYFSSIPNSIGWLDCIQLNFRRDLIMIGNQMHFRDIDSKGVGNISEFQVSSTNSSLKIYDVSDPINIKLINSTYINGESRFTASTDTLKEFLAITGDMFFSPSFEGKIVNQNLHALDGDIEYVIISHPDFLQAANRLADFHFQTSNLNSIVITPDQIYNEFSSGAQDVSAIRDFLRMLYLRDNSSLKYVLLFGDGSYDPKDRIANNTNYIPTYQSISSLHPTTTYVTDDFYGLLDENEGLFQNDLVDIGIGRIPVSSLEEADNAVNKIKSYYSLDSFGEWRNIVAFVADDGDAYDGNTHMWQADSLANIVDDTYKTINIEKFYLDDYTQISTPGGPRSPDMQEDINYRIQKGALLVNYTGHGGELGWTQERILELDQINSWTNQHRLPLFMTATCKFSRFDDPEIKSAGEQVLLNPNGGAIALLSTTRLVYSSPNYNLNTKFIKTLFEKQNGETPRLGDIFKQTKILSGTAVNNRNFSLLGDPALKLAYPTYNIVTTSIVDTLNALMEVTISGEIQNDDSIRVSDFNGIVYPTVFDKKIIQTTLGQESCTEMPYRIQKNIIYKGQATVANGVFSFSFVVPKDINYEYGNGKISYYAVNEGNNLFDANGYDDSFIIGGSASGINYDYEDPNIELFLNNENFVSGGITDENPTLIAFLSDLSGINTVGNGIGHDIVAILDDNYSNPFVLNDFYQASQDDYTEGKIEFPFYNLSPGKHTLSLKAWDVFNNSAEATITFFVNDSDNFFISNFLNYPNPFSQVTQFYFEHNQTDRILSIDLNIYSVSGMRVANINKTINENGYRIGPINWSARDNVGKKIPAGIYLANLHVNTENGNFASKSIPIILLPEK